MKKLVLLEIMLACVVPLSAQNWTAVTATNITDLNQQKLATGQLCFLGTDQNDVPISFNVGGGGQVLKRAFCSAVTNGIAASFTVPNPAGTTPTGIYYRVTVKDVNSGQEVLRYNQVSFTGASFNFDNYAPTNLGQFASLTGTAVTGNLSVNGNLAATGTVTASNIPTSILQQVFNSGTGLTQRTALNMTAGLQCADNAGTSRTDCRLGTLTTLVFSATPIFDASTAATFKLTLTGNVTSSTLSGAVAGEPLAFLICQDATGGRTFVPPTNVLGWVTIPTSANACVLETFIYDGTNAQADGDTAGQVLAQDGNVSAPSIAFENAANMGFYKLTSTCFATGISSGNQIIWCPGLMRNKSGGFVGFSPNADPNLATSDVGVFRSASGILGVSTAESPFNTAGELDARTVGITGSTSGATKLVTDAAASGTATVKAGTYNVVGDSLTQTLTNKTLDTAGPNTIKINGNTLSATAGTAAVTIPNSTDTLVGRATTDTLTNKTLDTAGPNTIKINGNTLSATAGTATVTIPNSTDTLVGRATTDTLTNKTLGGTTPFNRLRANQGTPVTTADWVISGLTGLGSWGSTASIVTVAGTDTAGVILISCSGTGQAANAPFKLTFHDGTFTTNPIGMVTRLDGLAPAGPAAYYAVSPTSITFGFNGVCVPTNTYGFAYLIIGQ